MLYVILIDFCPFQSILSYLCMFLNFKKYITYFRFEPSFRFGFEILGTGGRETTPNQILSSGTLITVGTFLNIEPRLRKGFPQQEIEGTKCVLSRGDFNLEICQRRHSALIETTKFTESAPKNTHFQCFLNTLFPRKLIHLIFYIFWKLTFSALTTECFGVGNVPDLHVTDPFCLWLHREVKFRLFHVHYEAQKYILDPQTHTKSCFQYFSSKHFCIFYFLLQK